MVRRNAEQPASAREQFVKFFELRQVDELVHVLPSDLVQAREFDDRKSGVLKVSPAELFFLRARFLAAESNIHVPQHLLAVAAIQLPAQPSGQAPQTARRAGRQNVEDQNEQLRQRVNAAVEKRIARL